MYIVSAVFFNLNLLLDLQGSTLEETLKGVCELSQPLSYSSVGLHLITGVA